LFASEEAQVPLFSHGILFQQPDIGNVLEIALMLFDGNPEGINILRMGL